MALCHYPCPEEVDVFSGPHIRMKQLVYEAFEKLSATNFKDDVSLASLLGVINSAFEELKHHEEIEDTCILTQLQHRLINKQILAVVNDVHKDNRVLEILSLTRKGLKSASKSRPSWNRNTFEDRLKEALKAFQKDFLPHMRHEEEVFQPLLMEYFTFEELKDIKARVLYLHNVFREHAKDHPTESSSDEDSHIESLAYQENSKNSFKLPESERTKTKRDLSEENSKERTTVSNENKSIGSCSFKDLKSTEKVITRNVCGAKVGEQQPSLLSFPSEITLKIFSYLGPKDLCRCAQVCWLWSQATRDGELWRELYPVRWIFKKDWRFGGDTEDGCTCDCDSEISYSVSVSSAYADSDTDKESCSEPESIGSVNDSETSPEMRQLLGFVRYLIPVVGPSVWVLKLGCCPMLSNGLAFKILSHCPNVRQLVLSQTAVSDFGLKGLFRKGRDLQLQYLDVSGCKNITDKTLFQLSSSLGKLPSSDGISDIEDNSCDCHTSCSCVHKISVVPELSRRGLVHLGLSGCYQVTDAGLRALARYGGLPKLRHLDLSGCLQVTAQGLMDLVNVCPNLDHAEFFYCDNIDEGPYPDTASGCQNLQCKNRVCCRTGE
ncbi:F-box/LRR-repeat protein 5-like isoform X1 [Montipora foliosa]|uniref:F-box/LRR-repeat protein 5-like isoform X1 n=1 Tax=Montipora foliosa TaxID=591990 RepID=UPI0035F20DA6